MSNISGFHQEDFSVHSSNHFSTAFVNEVSSNASEQSVVRKPHAPTAEAKKAGNFNNDARETPRASFQRAEPAQYKKYSRNSQPAAYGFVILFQESWVFETCTGSQEIQQLWQAEALFQHKKT